MGEFKELSVVKTAARKLVTPLADLAALNSIVDGVLENNLFECSAYQVGTTSHLPMEKTRESYTARIAYQDDDARTLGSVSARTSTPTGYTSAITAINANASLKTAIGATAVSHNPADDTLSVTLKCHDPNGELYTVTRDTITVASYADEGIRGRMTSGADTIPALT